MPPVQEKLSLFANQGGVIDASSDIAVATNWKTRDNNEVSLSDDKGVGGIKNNFWYRTFFNLTDDGDNRVFSPIAVANEVGDAQTLIATLTDAVFIWHQKSANRYRLFHVNNGSVEFVNTTFALISPNIYAHDLIRSGTSFTANLHDITGGHGTPLALVSTATLNTTLPLVDHRYLETALSFSDGADNVSDIDITFELWNMLADGVANNPLKSAMFGDRGFIAG